MLKPIIAILFFTLSNSSVAFAESADALIPPTTAVNSPQPLAIPISTVIKNVQAAGYPLITSIELVDGIYKIKALDMQGTQIAILLDPQKGSIIKPKDSKNIQITLLDAIIQVQVKGYHGIYKVVADDGTYDVYALDNQGNKATLEVDATTGKISKSWF